MKKYWYLLVSVIVLVILVGCGHGSESAFIRAYVQTEILTRTIDGYYAPVSRVIDVQAGVVCYVGDD